MGPVQSLAACFVDVDKGFRKEAEARRGGRAGWHPGCTALCALLVGNRLLVANAGDCRTLVCREGAPVALSRDHTGSDADERERVKDMGGSMEWRVGAWRVGEAGLEVTRSIGDGDLKPAVTAAPEIYEHWVEEEDEVLVVASDGLWGAVSNEEAVRLVADTVKDPFLAAQRLATAAVERGSKDNVTVIVVFLKRVTTVERVY